MPRVLVLPPNCELPATTTAAVAPLASRDRLAMPASDRVTPRRGCRTMFSTQFRGSIIAAARSTRPNPRGVAEAVHGTRYWVYRREH